MNTDPTPIRYKLHIEPDLSDFRFSGELELLAEASAPVDEFRLHAVDLAIRSCALLSDEEERGCRFCIDPSAETLEIRFPEKVSGRFTIRIRYEGIINDRMTGFYRSRYFKDGAEKYIAVTQFQESDARRAFPCVDHPKAKAAFDVALVVDEDLIPLSNSAEAETVRLGGGKKRVRFHTTPPMSTYLLFFGAGAFDMIEDPGRVIVRAATVPGNTAYAGYGLEFGKKALRFCEEYFDIPYPLPKMDLIAIPDFAFGAMENWGAITFRENLLLFHPETTSRAGEERICEVVAHEIVHQWFGNLVTPSDWKYLWLNESFATYFGFGIIDHFLPEWEIWHRFMDGQTDRALERDGLYETFPIEIPGGEHVVINTSTAPIIYSKGGAILRQIEGYIGAANFREGLRRYLKTHAYGCASSEDLWKSFEAVSEMPVTAMIRNWVERPGYPIVRAGRDGSKLFLTQERFTYLQEVPEEVLAGKPAFLSAAPEWMIPVKIRLFEPSGTRELDILLDGKQAVVEIGDAEAYLLNAGWNGFYRVGYLDRENLLALRMRVQEKKLPAEDRWGLQSDLYARMRKGEETLESYLEFLSAYAGEEAYLPLSGIDANLYQAYLVVGEEIKKKIAGLALPLFERVLSRIGFDPAGSEPQPISHLREQLLWHAAVYGSKDACDFGRSRFALLGSGGSIHPDLMKSVMQIAALTGGEDAFAWLDKRFRSAESEHERMNILTAIGCFREKGALEKAMAYVIETVPHRNKFVPVTAMGSNPHAIPFLWDLYISRLSELEKLHPMLYERVIASVIPVCGIERKKEVRDFFRAYLEKNPQFKDVIRLSLERLLINLRMRNGNP